MSQDRKTTSRAGFAISIFVVAMIATVFGCGGGGSSTTGSTTATASSTGSGSTTATTGSTTATTGSTTATTGSTTATTGSTTATTGSTTATTGSTTATTGSTTATTGSTTGSSGTINGQLPVNVLVYSYGTSTNTQVDAVAPNGTGDTNYGSFDSTIQGIAPNPAVSNQFVYGYEADQSTGLFDVYLGPGAGGVVSGANSTKRLTTDGFSSIFSIQFSPDGSKIIFVAAKTAGGNSSLYVVNVDGTGERILDTADDAFLGDDGTSIVYTKFDNTNAVGQIWAIQTNGAGQRQVTSDLGDHFAPQWSKDLSHITWTATPASNSVGGSYDIYVAAADGSQVTQVTNEGTDNAITPAYSDDGNAVGYILVSISDTTKSGLYTIGINGLGRSATVINSQINSGLFWTNATGTSFLTHRGRVQGITTAPCGVRDYHIERLRRLGRWHS